MTFLLVILAGLTLVGVGYLVGNLNGYDQGRDDAYRAVERHYEGHRKTR